MLLDYWFGPKSVDRMKHRTAGVWWYICMAVHHDKKTLILCCFRIVIWTQIWCGPRYYRILLYEFVISFQPHYKDTVKSRCVRAYQQLSQAQPVVKLTLKRHLSAWCVKSFSTAMGNLKLESLLNQYVRNKIGWTVIETLQHRRRIDSKRIKLTQVLFFFH